MKTIYYENIIFTKKEVPEVLSESKAVIIVNIIPLLILNIEAI